MFIATALACAVHLSAWAVTALDPKMISMLGLDNYKTIRLLDINGTPLTTQEFMERLSGNSFSISKNSSNGSASLRITATDPTSAIPKKIGLNVGDKLPDLKLTDVEGRTHTWESLGRKPVVLNFFFAECAPCIEEVPELNTLGKNNPDIAVLAVTFDNKATTVRFIQRHGLQWPTVTDARPFIKKLGVTGYPTTLLVSPQRTLIAFKSGGGVALEGLATTNNGLETWVRQNLKLQ